MKQLNEEVEFNQDSLLTIDAAFIERIKQKASANASGKFRTCVHRSEDACNQEMFIVHSSSTYVRPHKHRSKDESLQVIEGYATVIFFDQDGEITSAFELGDLSSGHPFFCKINHDLYHMLIIHSDFLVFKETTTGPFQRQDMIFPKWAPEVDSTDSVEAYLLDVRQRLKGMGHKLP